MPNSAAPEVPGVGTYTTDTKKTIVTNIIENIGEFEPRPLRRTTGKKSELNHCIRFKKNINKRIFILLLSKDLFPSSKR